MQLEGSEVYLPKDVPFAAFDANEVRGQCLEGTRTNLLDDYYGWIKTAAAVPAIDISTGREGLGQSEAYAEIVRWIYGLAGTGKTTFAWTIAKWCKDSGLLGGSFFCSGNADGCNEATSIFPTIALQLCRINDSFKRNVIAVMKKDKHIADSAPARQLEELILRPLEELQEPFPRLVLVVDALDQCRDKKGSAILAAFSKFLPRISKFFLLVLTGRPEPYLTRHFESSRPECLGPATKQLDLYMVDQEMVSNDIRLTLIHDLRSPEGSISGPPGWPDDEKIDTLTTLSHGLFIYARTAARWVMDATVGDPENRFERLVTKQKAQDRQSSTPQDLMNDIYGQIVSEAHPHVSEELEQRLQEVVGTIVLAEESLSVDSLAELLDLSNTQIRNTLSGLHSVLHVPADHGPVRVIHPTFSEFLVRKESKKPQAFYIHPTQRHYALFRRCLIVMCTSLHYDILSTGDAAIFKKEIAHLDEKIARYIKLSLSYACRHWGNHLSRATGDDLTPSFGDLEKFVRGYLLFWLEACSFLEALDRVLYSLSAALHFCQTHAGQFANLLPLISNFRQFALTYSVCIDIAPLQVYHSAMALAPKGTPITESYAPSPGSIIVHRGEMEHWDACLNAFFWFKIKDGEPAPGVAIAISTSGAYFATGGIRGGMKIWRTLTCNLVLSIDHPDLRNIRSLAFSPNDSYIASGLDDGTVHIWDAGTGAPLRVLHCGDTPVRSITYHPSGTRILYAVNCSIGLQDTLSDQHSVLLDTCPGLRQVGLSPDGDTIAYGTENSLELYNIASKDRRSFGPFESKVNLVTISPTGREVAACSRAVWVWNLSDNSQIFYAPLGQPIQAFQVAFSNDGARIGVACNDGSVRIWSVDEGSASLRTLLRHPQQAHDLVWSLDNCQIVSVGDDYSVHVWDAVQPNKHFVCDNTPFASESTDYHGDQNSDGISVISPRLNSFTVPSGVTTPNTISRASMHTPLPPAHGDLVQIEHAVSPTNTRELLGEFNWEFLTGSRTREPGWIMKTSSPDGTHDVWVSFDRRTIYIRNVSDPDTATITINSAGEVFSMALSPNNELLATGCGKEHGILLYKTWDGSFFRSLSPHRARILSVAFSSDGDLIISGSEDRAIEVYSVSRDDLLGSLRLHQHAVTHVAFVQEGPL